MGRNQELHRSEVSDKKKMYEDIATDGMDKNITPNVDYCKSQTVLSHAGKGIHGIFQLFQQMGHREHLENLKSTNQRII